MCSTVSSSLSLAAPLPEALLGTRRHLIVCWMSEYVCVCTECAYMYGCDCHLCKIADMPRKQGRLLQLRRLLRPRKPHSPIAPQLISAGLLIKAAEGLRHQKPADGRVNPQQNYYAGEKTKVFCSKLSDLWATNISIRDAANEPQ